MFEVEYKGANTVVVKTKKSTLIFDPALSVAGSKDTPVKDSIIAATESRLKGDGGSAHLVIDGPGEYEAGDFSITGVAAQRHIDDDAARKQATLYRVEVGEVAIGVLGNIDPKLSEDQQEALGVVDILILPVGGNGYTLDATSAAALTRSISPKAVIPVHYADTTLTYEVPQEQVSVFTGDLGAPVETVTKYKVKSAASLPTALTAVVVERST